MRLIDAENLLKQYEQIDWYCVSKEGQFMRGATTEDNPFIHYYDGEEIINNAPTIDAVPVVRCEYCIRRYDTDECPMCYLSEGKYYEYTNENGFCDRGERKEGDE